jgi:hypothetical protein
LQQLDQTLAARLQCPGGNPLDFLLLGGNMANVTNPEKKVDIPPSGRRNADPITNAPGSHPIETGIGAAAVGAASGMAAGAVTGPLGAAIGAAVGAVAGGYVGKGVGEMIDPTTEDNWLRENFKSRPYVEEGDTFDTFTSAYRYGAMAESQYGAADFDAMDEDLERDWEDNDAGDLSWPRARGAVKDAYDRTVQLRRERNQSSPCKPCG